MRILNYHGNTEIKDDICFANKIHRIKCLASSEEIASTYTAQWNHQMKPRIKTVYEETSPPPPTLRSHTSRGSIQNNITIYADPWKEQETKIL
jgi:hypothetical protein